MSKHEHQFAFPSLARFTTFVIERHRIYLKRHAGQPQPWTKDPILSVYKFTNVYRELDRVTVWIRQRWREPLVEDKDLWFAMVIARLINHPPSLALFSHPTRWDPDRFIHLLRRRKRAGEKTFGSAYIVSTGGLEMSKDQHLAHNVLQPMWDKRKTLRPRDDDSLKSWFGRLMQCNGMGTFIAAQIVADMKFVMPLRRNADDWWTFAASGPGSRRGLSYVCGFSPDERWHEHEWKDALDELMDETRATFKAVGMPRLSAQDLQNCLCEFSKYRRTQLGTGRPKQKFVPFTEDRR